MNEEKETQGESQEEGQQSETSKSLVEKAEAAADRIEAANTKQEELIQRAEDAKTKQMLSGRANAGQSQVVTKDEETPHEYRVRVEKELAEGKTEFGN